MMERKVRETRSASFVRRVSLRSLCALRSNVVVAGVAAVLLTASPVFADLSVAMHDGRVSIVARDATVRQILAEWARVGGTRIVNVEKIPGGPVTLVLENVTEMQALEVLLRPLSGYIAAPRAVAASNLSAYDRIIIMPTLAAEGRPPMAPPAAPSAGAFPAAPPPPVFQQAAPMPTPTQDDQSNEDTTGTAVTAGNVGGEPAEFRPPPANTFQKGLEVGRPSEYRTPPRSPLTGAGAPGPATTGVAVPGMMAPLPNGQPGTAGQHPAAPGQPVRRPGGP
jgi:hypothetical protein